MTWALPSDRLFYAETLFDVYTTLSGTKPPALVLGVTGSGQLLKRRLTMILRGDVPCRFTLIGLLGALGLFFGVTILVSRAGSG